MHGFRRAASILLFGALAGCSGGNGGESTSGGVTPGGNSGTPTMPSTAAAVPNNVGQALLGPVSGGEVAVYPLGSSEPACTTTAQSGTTYSTAGVFAVPDGCLATDGYYVIVVSGGSDLDVDADGVFDSAPTLVQGSFHVVLTREDIVAGGWKVSALTEAVYQTMSLKLGLRNSPAAIAADLASIAQFALEGDVNGDSSVDYFDILAWTPRDNAAQLRVGIDRARTLENIIRQDGDTRDAAFAVAAGTGALERVAQSKSLAMDDMAMAPSSVSIASAGDLLLVAEVETDKSTLKLLSRSAGSLATSGVFPLAATTTNVAARTGRAYLAQGMLGSQVIDTSDPAAPASMWTGFLGDTRDIAILGSGLLLSVADAGLVIATEESSGELRERSSIRLPEPDSVAGQIKVQDSIAWVAAGAGGAYAIDVSDLDNPRILAHIPAVEMVADIDVVANVAYVLEPTQLRIFELTSNGSSMLPTLRGDLSLVGEFRPGQFSRVAALGSIVYAASGAFGTTVVDVSSTSAPAPLLSFLPEVDRVNDMILVDGQLVVAANAGVAVFIAADGFPP